MPLDHKGIQSQLCEITETNPPVKRAAYSDRTSWMMAVLAQLAYDRFEGSGENMLTLAAELARLGGNKAKIATRLLEVSELLCNPSVESTQKLEATLMAGGLKLKGVINKTATDTQGFVAVREKEGDHGIAVLVFRGTQEIRDWKTNLDATTVPINGPEEKGYPVIGRMHAGFNAAYLSVQEDVNELLKDIPPEMPIYICGHSLGGALATVATWYLPAKNLAACYTFGAPRVGTPDLVKYYRTPIYRVVNGMDPVPNVPPGGGTIGFLKIIVRASSVVLSGAFTDWALKALIKRQGYRHYGDIRYLTDEPPGDSATYPDLDLLTGVSALERFYRFIRLMLQGKVSFGVRIDKYHDIGLYRDKLRAYSIHRRSD